MSRPVLHYFLPGDPRTKKNHMTIAGTGPLCPVCRKPRDQHIRQGHAHDAWAEAALRHIHPIPAEPIDYPVHIMVMSYMATRRRVDGLNLLAAVDDLLVHAGVLQDDNAHIVISHDGSRVCYDRENPRTEIYITEAEDAQKNDQKRHQK